MLRVRTLWLCDATASYPMQVLHFMQYHAFTFCGCSKLAWLRLVLKATAFAKKQTLQIAHLTVRKGHKLPFLLLASDSTCRLKGMQGLFACQYQQSGLPRKPCLPSVGAPSAGLRLLIRFWPILHAAVHSISRLVIAVAGTCNMLYIFAADQPRSDTFFRRAQPWFRLMQSLHHILPVT